MASSLGALLGGCAWIAGVSGDVQLVVDADAPADAALADVADDDVTDAAQPIEADAPDDVASDSGANKEAGLPSDGSKLACGSGACSVGQEQCCFTQAQAPTCGPSGGACAGAIARCDEALDCDAGQVCCVTGVRAYGLQTECRPSCDAGQAQACRTNVECGGTACAVWPCAKGIAQTCGGAGADAGCVP